MLRNWWLKILFLIGTLLNIVPTFSQSSDNITVVGRILPGADRTIYVQDDYAYINGGRSVIILDVSDITNARQVGLITLPPVLNSGIYKVHPQGDYLYVANGTGGLRVLDIADPAHPALVATINQFALGLYVQDFYAYISDGNRHLFIVDISDPTNPVLVGTFDSGDISAGNEVWVVGEYAYVVYNTLNGFRGLRIIDVSDPTQPTLAGELRTPGGVYGLSISGNYAYLASGPAGLRIVDIADPTRPLSVGQLVTGNVVEGVFASGRFVYLAGFNPSVFHVVDATDPAHPVEVGSLRPNSIPWKVFVRGDYAYLADVTGLRIIDVSEPRQPTPVDFFATDSVALDVSIMGDYVYVVSGNVLGGLQIVNTAEIESPKLVGYHSGRISRRIRTRDNIAYFTDVTVGLEILDVADPTHPIILGRFTRDRFFPIGLFVKDPYIYIASDGPGLLYIIDVSDPSNPVLTGSAAVGPWAYNVWVDGRYAYVAAGKEGLKVFDVSDPASPREVGRWSDPNDSVYDVAVKDNRAYLADGFQDIYSQFAGLRVLDTTDPTHPELVGSWNNRGSPHSLAVEGNYVYLCDTRNGLRILEVSKPAEPREAGFFAPDSTEVAEHVVVSENRIYLANGAGVYILQFDPPPR